MRVVAFGRQREIAITRSVSASDLTPFGEGENSGAVPLVLAVGIAPPAAPPS
jgi:hypothetical protein